MRNASRLYFPDAALPLETLADGVLARKIRASGGRLMMVEMFFPAGATGAAHSHVHEQASYCLAGEFEFFIDGEKITLRAGDSLYIPAGAQHGTLCLAAGRLLDVFTPQRDDFLAS